MDVATSQFVRERAANRCEYCRLQQDFAGLRFHVEHVIARQHGGSDAPDNLALACPECNLRKGPNLTGIDPDSGKITPLFHPRRDRWDNHFTRVEASLIGTTAVGRTTAWLLEMNSGERLRLRGMLVRLGLWE